MKKLFLFVLIAAFAAACSDVPVQDELLEEDVMLKKGKKTSIVRVPQDYETIQDAIDATEVVDGTEIQVANGEFAGAYVTKAVTIKGSGKTLVNDGPVHSSGKIMGFRLLAGSDGAIFNNLTFEVDFPIMNGAAINDVIVTQCLFNNSVQAITNWCGSEWEITHNNIVDLRCDNGGGIGILIGDYLGGIVENNVVSHNKVSGTLYVPDTGENGGYSGAGIVIYSDSRWGSEGSEALKNNKILHNKVSLTSNNFELVDVVAFELTDSENDEDEIIIFDNKIGFNDFRETELQIALTPENLDEFNVISRNLGKNRGHGLHPSVFK